MTLNTVLSELSLLQNDFILLLGFFDGIHLGHQLLIEKAKEYQKENPSYKIILLTFTFPPSSFLHQEQKETLFSIEERAIIYKKLEIDFSFFLTPSLDIFNLNAKNFLEKFYRLGKKIHFILGSDALFGNDRKGGGEFLSQMQQDFHSNFSFQMIENQTINGIKISSSNIRELLKKGEIKEMNHLLSVPFFSYGTVVEGNKEGRLIGFPTLNIAYAPYKIIPPYGVYTVRIEFNQRIYKGLSYISNFKMNEVFKSPISETWVLDFNEEIYGQNVSIFFEEFKRAPLKVNGLEELKKLLEKDKSSLE